MKFVIPVVGLVLAACSRGPDEPNPEMAMIPPWDQRETHQIEFLSSPPGARIEVNGDYVGDTPCLGEIVTDGNGELVDALRINAYPIYRGHHVQTKRFKRSNKAPSRVFFDMGLIDAESAPAPTPELATTIQD